MQVNLSQKEEDAIVKITGLNATIVIQKVVDDWLENQIQLSRPKKTKSEMLDEILDS